MAAEAEQASRRLLCARDAMDRGYADPLDIPELARIAHVPRDRRGSAVRLPGPVPWRGVTAPTCFRKSWMRSR